MNCIPIPRINKDNQAEISAFNNIVRFVDRMLILRKKTSLTPQDKDFLQREIAANEAQIEKLVYMLYGLTEEEIGIVEGKE